jgi:hypothetical protein
MVGQITSLNQNCMDRKTLYQKIKVLPSVGVAEEIEEKGTRTLGRRRISHRVKSKENRLELVRKEEKPARMHVESSRMRVKSTC